MAKLGSTLLELVMRQCCGRKLLERVSIGKLIRSGFTGKPARSAPTIRIMEELVHPSSVAWTDFRDHLYQHSGIVLASFAMHTRASRRVSQKRSRRHMRARAAREPRSQTHIAANPSVKLCTVECFPRFIFEQKHNQKSTRYAS